MTDVSKYQGLSLRNIVTGNAGGASQVFDLAVQAIIIISICGLVIETVPDLDPSVRSSLAIIEIGSIVIFSFEYGLRIYAAERKLEYLLSFWGIVDFLAIVPTLLFSGLDFRALRTLRLMRLLRLLKLGRYSIALQRLSKAVEKVKDEFVCFLYISALVYFLAACGIYYFENQAQPEQFASIPAAMWWAVATLTTVGYGDVYPITVGGKIFTTIILMIGLGLVAIPAGLVAAAFQETDGETEVDDSRVS